MCLRVAATVHLAADPVAFELLYHTPMSANWASRAALDARHQTHDHIKHKPPHCSRSSTVRHTWSGLWAPSDVSTLLWACCCLVDLAPFNTT
eukprot:1432743-Amphidinium_carterae.1